MGTPPGRRGAAVLPCPPGREAGRREEHPEGDFGGAGGWSRHGPSIAGRLPRDGILGIAGIDADDGSHELAFLSACKTATGGLDHADEAITLTAALHYAGWQQVIGTLWSVYDLTSAQVAKTVYAALALADADEPPPAARALAAAVRRLRRSYPDQPTIWATFIHVGP